MHRRSDCRQTVGIDLPITVRVLPSNSLRPLVVIALLLGFASSFAAEEYPLLIWQDPKLELYKTKSSFTPQLKGVWIKSLQGTAPDVRRRACFTISLAHRRGLKGLEDAVPHLRKVLTSADENPLVRLEAAKALQLLGAKDAAVETVELIKGGFFENTLTLEPTLVEWKVAAAKEIWLARMKQPDCTAVAKSMAIRGLVALGTKEIIDPLQAIVKNKRAHLSVRIAAANALSRLADAATISKVEEQFANAGAFEVRRRLIAVHLIAEQKTTASLDKLKKLSEDSLGVIAAVAAEALVRNDPEWARENATRFLISNEPRICRCGLEALANDTSRSAMARIARQMNNRFSSVRTRAREILEKHSRNPLARLRVLGVIDDNLLRRFGTNWRGLSELARLIGNLKAKEKAAYLNGMVSHPRREVATPSAWAAAELAMPITFRAVLDQAIVLSHRSKMSDPNMEDTEIQFALLLQTFAKQPYRDAMPLLQSLVGKNINIGAKPRAVAIWLLGKYYEGKRNEPLVRELVGRLNDIDSMIAEAADVRAMSAVAIARINTKLGKDSLDRFVEDTNPSVKAACRWAMNKREGTPIPPAPVRILGADDWFIQALEPEPAKKKKKKQEKKK